MGKYDKRYQVDEAAGILDELQAFYLGKADGEGWVYTSVLRQLVNRMYRERDYLAKRVQDGRKTAYDYAVDRDQKALAWAIRALVQHVPAEKKVDPRAAEAAAQALAATCRPRSAPRPRASRVGTASPSGTGTGQTSRRSNQPVSLVGLSLL